MAKKSRELVPPGLSFIADNIISSHNIMGSSKAMRSAWADGLGLARQSDTVFFAGCGYQYISGLESLMSLLRKMDKSPVGAEVPMNLAGIPRKVGINPASIYSKLTVKKDSAEGSILRDAVKVLRYFGVDFSYLAEDEPCCGGLLYYAGLEKEFNKNAENLYKQLRNGGVKNIISIVPSCTYSLKTLIPKYIENYDLQVTHFSQIVADRMKNRELKLPQEIKATYHDPCQLSRYMGIVEEPRHILNSIKGLELVETEWTNRRWSTCCGGGGGFEAVFPEMSEMLAENRAKELVETGASIIITHCPGCIMQIQDGLKKLNREDIKVLDLAQVIAMAIGE